MRRMIPQKQINYIEQLEEQIEINGTDVQINDCSFFQDGDAFSISYADSTITFSDEDGHPCFNLYGESPIELNCQDITKLTVNDKGVQISINDEPVATFSNEVKINVDTDNTPRSFSINSYGIQSPIDEYSLCFGLDFDGEQGGIHWTDEPGAGLVVAPNGNVQIYGGTSIKMVGLPTSDPHVKNQLWNDNGVLKISSGS